MAIKENPADASEEVDDCIAARALIKRVINERGLELSRPGSKNASLDSNHAIDPATGVWADPTQMAKPVRWLIHLQPTDEGVTACLPQKSNSGTLCFLNASHEVSGVIVRILALLKLDDGTFRIRKEWEWNLLLCFNPPLPVGSSSEVFHDFQPDTGTVRFRGSLQPYQFAGLIELRKATDEWQDESLPSGAITYRDATNALADLIHVCFLEEEPVRIKVYDGCSSDDLGILEEHLRKVFADLRSRETLPTGPGADTQVKFIKPKVVPPSTDLLGIDPDVYDQINGAIQSGKCHLMFYGPPGTGKTTLAVHVAVSLSQDHTLITGSADWTSQDIIGGYQPVGAGKIEFIKGILLRKFDQPLIIDELNRCDIDKVIGPLFTVLSGQSTELPYRVNADDRNSDFYVIHGSPSGNDSDRDFFPGAGWRIIATINSIDKASLYQMSYALTRRFAWIYVGVPSDLSDFLKEWMSPDRPNIASVADTSVVVAEEIPPAIEGRADRSSENEPDSKLVLANLWSTANSVREIGPAPFLDCIRYIRSIDGSFDFYDDCQDANRARLYWGALSLFVLPMLDGIHSEEAAKVAEGWKEALGLSRLPNGVSLAEEIGHRLNERAL